MKTKKINRNHLPEGLKEPIRELRYKLSSGASVTVFSNNEGHLPPAGRGSKYYEYDVGADRTGGRGKFRIVALVDFGNKLQSLYFTSEHYEGGWTEIV